MLIFYFILSPKKSYSFYFLKNQNNFWNMFFGYDLVGPAIKNVALTKGLFYMFYSYCFHKLGVFIEVSEV